MKNPSLGFSDVEMTRGLDTNTGFRLLVILQTRFLFLVQSSEKKGHLMLFIRVFAEGQCTGKKKIRKQMSCVLGGHPPEHSWDLWRQPSANRALFPAVNREGEPGVYQRKE